MEEERRFGKRGIAPSRPKIVEVVQDLPPTKPASDDSTLNAGFIATAVALFFAVGGGTLFFLNDGFSLPQLNFGSGETKPAYVSSVDQKCSKGWRKDLPNIDQMHCSMTINLHRLCEPEERAHLVATISRFEEDYGVWSRRHFAAAMGSIFKAQGNSLEIGMGAAEMEHAMADPKLSDAERQKKIDKFEKTMGYVLDEPNKILAESKNDTPHYQLEYDLTALASKGLIEAGDFGWRKPDWVKRGFASVKSVSPACAK